MQEVGFAGPWGVEILSTEHRQRPLIEALALARNADLEAFRQAESGVEWCSSWHNGDSELRIQRRPVRPVLPGGLPSRLMPGTSPPATLRVGLESLCAVGDCGGDVVQRGRGEAPLLPVEGYVEVA
jgi:hypothetical protein